MKILLVGMMGLYNRGCEAIVWGSAEILRRLCPGAEIGLAVGFPDSVTVDQARLSDLDVEWYPFCHRPSRSIAQRLRYRIQRALGGTPLPRAAFPFDGWDLILEVGGDTFTGADVMSRFRFDARLRKVTGSRLGLWCMNMGPYSPQTLTVSELRAACEQYDIITVRDDFSFRYLRDSGVTRGIFRMADPAFEMAPKAWNLDEVIPSGSQRGLIGLNLSPFAARFLPGGHAAMCNLAYEIGSILIDQGFSVLYVPHCFGPACPPFDDDLTVLAPAYERLRTEGYPVGILPEGLSSPEVKYAISKCRLFCGTRMHSTIAAWSTGVPVLTLAYSQKARNLNYEVYAHERYLMDIGNATADVVSERLQAMDGEWDMAKSATCRGVEAIRRHTDSFISP